MAFMGSYTPEATTDLMSQMTTEPDAEVKTVNDPCCGSGRMQLSVAKINPHLTFHGHDIDIRCLRMCAINLVYRGLRGLVIQGDTLPGPERGLGNLG
jgi:type I restriction-modification system DNA methylase subunit